jgi:radical SAM protein with 4Fe4S-binding SPASM domain
MSIDLDNPGMPTDVSIITTYRCQMRCKMCNIWENPTDRKQEITPKDLEILPPFKFVNVTGGEPFVRNDLEDIVEVMFKKSDRIVISTSGWHTNKILKMAERFPNIGIRVSIEGLSQKNDDLRGREGGFDRGLKTLLGLKEMGVTDIGFGQTVSNRNSGDLIPLYQLSKELGMEFATAAFHNSYYFHRDDNHIHEKETVINDFHELIERLLKENNPKAWFRAFFNLGLINYINDGKRMLPCQAGTANFFIEPYGDVYPCNGLEERYWKKSMGNIRDVETFEDLWFSDAAREVRQLVNTCPKNCWMVGTAAPVMKKYIKHPIKWVAKNKLKSMLGRPICVKDIPHYDVGQDPLQGDLRLPENPVQDSTPEIKYILRESEVEEWLADAS